MVVEPTGLIVRECRDSLQAENSIAHRAGVILKKIRPSMLRTIRHRSYGGPLTMLDITTIVRDLGATGVRYVLTGSVAAAPYGVSLEPRDLGSGCRT